MPLTGTGGVLALALIPFTGGDVAGATKMTSLANALASWIVTNAIVTNIPTFGTLAASGAAVTGQGRIDFGADGNAFGDALAASIPAVDAAGISKWRALGSAIHSHIKTNGRANPTAFVANPLGGAVQGTGTLSFTTSLFSPTLAAVLGLVDAPNQAVWLALGAAILAYLAANAQIGLGVGLPTGFLSPSGGGPLTIVSVIT